LHRAGIERRTRKVPKHMCSVKLLSCSVIAVNNITSITSAGQVASDSAVSM